MPRFLVGEGEDLLAEFRPHPASYVARYLLALLWIGAGALGMMLQLKQEAGGLPWMGLGAFASFAFGFAATARAVKRSGLWAGLFWGCAAIAAIFIPEASGLAPPLVPLLIGILAGLATFAHAELDRSRRSVHVTTRRVVVQGGLGRLDEASLSMDRIASVRASQSLLGQMFGYGALIVTLETRSRKAGAVSPSEVLTGVPKSGEVRAAIEAGLEERKLTPKERAKRGEERRLKSSMRALAAWAPRD